MAEEPDEPRATRADKLAEVEREDLDLYSVDGLTERIDRLAAEIERAKAKRASKQSGRSAADALFKF